MSLDKMHIGDHDTNLSDNSLPEAWTTCCTRGKGTSAGDDLSKKVCSTSIYLQTTDSREIVAWSVRKLNRILADWGFFKPLHELLEALRRI